MLMDKVDTCMLIDIGLRFYAVHHNSPGDLEVKVTDLRNFVFKFLVKVFVSLYLLTISMD